MTNRNLIAFEMTNNSGYLKAEYTSRNIFPIKSHLNALNALTHWESITTFLAVWLNLCNKIHIIKQIKNVNRAIKVTTEYKNQITFLTILWQSDRRSQSLWLGP